MNKRVCIIYPKNDYQVTSRNIPLGALQLVSYLREKQISVDFCDLNQNRNPVKALEQICASGYDFVGLSSNVANYKNTIFSGRFFKENSSKMRIIVGGSMPSCMPEIFLQRGCCDVVAIGEGEHTLYEYIMNGRNVNGLALVVDGRLYLTPPRELIKNLDELPFPALDLIKLKDYNYVFQKRKVLSSIITSRGCPFRCPYCFHGVFGYNWRVQSPERVAREIEWQQREFGVQEFNIWDDNFTLDIQRTRRICEFLIEKRNNVVWQCPNGIRATIDFKTLKMMKEAGLWMTGIAPESGDPFVFNKINKQFKLHDVERAIQYCKKLNIFTCLFFIIGLPYERPQTLQLNDYFIRKLDPDFIEVQIFTPMPNTPILKEFPHIKPEINRGFHQTGKNRVLKRTFYKMQVKFFSQPRKLVKLISTLGPKNFFQLIHNEVQTRLNIL